MDYPIFCFNCESLPKWKEKTVNVKQFYRNKLVVVEMNVLVCTNCGFKLTRKGDTDFLVRKVKEEFNKQSS